MRADTFRSLVADNSTATTQFFRLMQGYLALGLVVGIAGLGVIMVRAVRERRRQIGMLRSLGFSASKVRAAFLFESGFVALEGIVIGTALALVTSYQIVVNSDALGDLRGLRHPVGPAGVRARHRAGRLAGRHRGPGPQAAHPPRGGAADRRLISVRLSRDRRPLRPGRRRARVQGRPGDHQPVTKPADHRAGLTRDQSPAAQSHRDVESS